jgi:hypothetical protein
MYKHFLLFLHIHARNSEISYDVQWNINLYLPLVFQPIEGLEITKLRDSEPGSSVSIVPGYGLDDRVIEFCPRKRRKDFFSSLCVQTGSGAHRASCPMDTGDPFPGAKSWPRCDPDHSCPSSAEVNKE